jgi:hypothetical protein
MVFSWKNTRILGGHESGAAYPEIIFDSSGF